MIEKETAVVGERTKVVQADEAVANEQAAEAKALKDECESELAEAIPALEAAIAALKTLKVFKWNLVLIEDRMKFLRCVTNLFCHNIGWFVCNFLVASSASRLIIDQLGKSFVTCGVCFKGIPASRPATQGDNWTISPPRISKTCLVAGYKNKLESFRPPPETINSLRPWLPVAVTSSMFFLCTASLTGVNFGSFDSLLTSPSSSQWKTHRRASNWWCQPFASCVTSSRRKSTTRREKAKKSWTTGARARSCSETWTFCKTCSSMTRTTYRWVNKRDACYICKIQWPLRLAVVFSCLISSHETVHQTVIV